VARGAKRRVTEGALGGDVLRPDLAIAT